MKNFKKGFTLVEMLIVVVIIGILAAAILPRLQGAQAATRDAAREKGINDIVNGVEMYMAAKGKYPDQGATNVSAKVLNGPLVVERNYLKDLPKDPRANQPGVKFKGKDGELGNYSYITIKRGNVESQGYVVAAQVETLDKANATAQMIEEWDSNTDYNDIVNKLCKTVDRKSDGNSTTWTEATANTFTGGCVIKQDSDLRYVQIR